MLMGDELRSPTKIVCLTGAQGGVIQNCERMIKSITRDRQACVNFSGVCARDTRLVMGLLDQLRRQFAYDDWANREVLAGLGACGITTGRAVQLMAHIFSAERLWLERLKHQPQSLPVCPEFTLIPPHAQAPDLDQFWRPFLNHISP